MFSIIPQYNTKGSIELHAMLVKYVQDICSSLILPRTFDEIAACMVEPEYNKVVDLFDS
jgi:hypothetical protein